MMRLLRYLGSVCLGETLPVWATVLGILVGAAGTYFIIPSLNENLERQKIRSEFIIRNLDDLNLRTRALVSDVSDLQYNVLRANIVDSAAVQKDLSKIAEMQWKAIELAVIFEGTTGASTVREYQESLDNVRLTLTNLKSKDDLKFSQAAIEIFSQRTLNVLRELASLGGLRMTTAQTPKN